MLELMDYYNNEFVIIDTDDKSGDFITKKELVHALELGVEIKGAKFNGNVLSITECIYNKDIKTKRRLLMTNADDMIDVDDYLYNKSASGDITLAGVPDDAEVIKIPNFVKEIFGWVFIGVKKSKCIIYGGEGLTKLDAAFNEISTNILDLSRLNTSNVTSMEYCFANSDINNLILGNIDTSKVTSMRGLFTSAVVDSVDLSLLNTENVNNMSDMFRNAKFKHIGKLSFNTSKVINMANMFDSLQTDYLDISSFDVSSVDYVTQMFCNARMKFLDAHCLEFISAESFKSFLQKAIIGEINLSDVKMDNGTDFDLALVDLDTYKLNLSGVVVGSITRKNNSNMITLLLDNSNILELNMSNILVCSDVNEDIIKGLFRCCGIDVLVTNSDTLKRCFDNAKHRRDLYNFEGSNLAYIGGNYE